MISTAVLDFGKASCFKICRVLQRRRCLQPDTDALNCGLTRLVSVPSQIVQFGIGARVVNLNLHSEQHRQLESVPEFG